MDIRVNMSEVTAAFTQMEGQMPSIRDRYIKEMALEAVATMKPLTPVAVRRWTPYTRPGELRGSIEIVKSDEGVEVGPLATAYGSDFQYGIAVERGTRWRMEPAQAGPRPFATEWTFKELELKAEPMAERIIRDEFGGLM